MGVNIEKAEIGEQKNCIFEKLLLKFYLIVCYLLRYSYLQIVTSVSMFMDIWKYDLCVFHQEQSRSHAVIALHNVVIS